MNLRSGILETNRRSLAHVLALAILCPCARAAAAPPLSSEGPSAESAADHLNGDSASAGQTGSQSTIDDDPMKSFRAPLLREGSTLVEARARLRKEAQQNWWTLIVDDDDDSSSSGATTHSPPHELILLPCTRLAEMVRIMESAAARSGSSSASIGGDVQFKVSGRVYVFRDRNYFLPTHAVVISEITASPATMAATTASAPAATSAAEPPATPPVTPANDDSAEAIARSLEQAAGPLARSSAGTAAAARMPGNTSPSESIDASHHPNATTQGSAMMQENTAIVNRRGKVTRDRSGGWLLVFDADASGLSDPPVKLLPCMLLESIEDYARRVGNNSPVIITGQVYLYDGQNHLLPTVYRIPRERSRLTP